MLRGVVNVRALQGEGPGQPLTEMVWPVWYLDTTARNQGR
jgi:hypothetical protein